MLLPPTNMLSSHAENYWKRGWFWLDRVPAWLLKASGLGNLTSSDQSKICSTFSVLYHGQSIVTTKFKLLVASTDEWQHGRLLLQHITNSEVNPKWLQWTKLIPPWSPSAWTSAKHWQARARSSTSHLLLVPPSPSPWTPGARFQGPRRRPVPQRSGEMPSAGKNSAKESSKALQLGFLLKVM